LELIFVPESAGAAFPLNQNWLDHLPLPAVIITKARFAYVNDAFLDLLMLTREQAVGMRFDERVAPEDSERIASRHRARLAGEAVPSSYQLNILRMDGARRAVEIFISQAGEDTLFQLYDITGRATHQENLSALARLGAAVQREHSEESIFRAVAAGLHAMGAAMIRLIPAGDGVRVIGDGTTSPIEPWGPGLRLAWTHGYAFLDDLKLQTFPGEDQRTWVQGAVVRLDVGGVGRELLVMGALWLRPEDQPTIALFGSQVSAALEANRLIVDLQRSYDELSRAQAQLVQRERLAALGEMAAALAHEVRNPLGVIFNSLASLPREISSGRDGAQLLAILKEEAHRINHLVGDLLDFARPALPLLSNETALPTLVVDAVGAVLATNPGKILFEVANPTGVGQVSMDARLMRQVFLNLANNAVQAMPQGGTLRVVLSLDTTGREPMVQVAFSDTGHGIPSEVLPRVFEPFFTTRARGTGLGLALVKRIVEGHRGRVEVMPNVDGKGTRAIVSWPI
jgi:PAS domain S-box-containing protein